MFYVIYNREGTTRVEELSKDELELRLNEEYYGKVNFNKVINDIDTDYWHFESLTIIKGNIVTPEVITTATKFNLK